MIMCRSALVCTVCFNLFTGCQVTNLSFLSQRASAVEMLTEAEADADIKTYQSMLESLMYAMIGTHPDLAFSVGILSKHSAISDEEHFCTMRRIYYYLQGTKDFRLTYQGTPPATDNGILGDLLGYINADWAFDVNDHQSVSGFVFILASAAITWLSKCQYSTAFSSTETKYMAALAVTKEAN